MLESLGEAGTRPTNRPKAFKNLTVVYRRSGRWVNDTISVSQPLTRWQGCGTTKIRLCKRAGEVTEES